jgi:hypothetical protein
MLGRSYQEKSVVGLLRKLAKTSDMVSVKYLWRVSVAFKNGTSRVNDESISTPIISMHMACSDYYVVPIALQSGNNLKGRKIDSEQ